MSFAIFSCLKEKIVTTKTDYTTEKWTLLLQSQAHDAI
jgi:hypothetical protein